MKSTVKTAVQVSEKVLRRREVKKEASRRCRARAKMLANGEVPTADLALRSLQPKAMKVENFKLDLDGKTIRMNRNGGTAVAIVTATMTPDGIVRTRKSYKDLPTAAAEFKKMVKEAQA